MLFLVIFLHFLTVGHAKVGEECNFTTNPTGGCADVSAKEMECITRGGQLLDTEADYNLTSCSLQSPFKQCVCHNTKTLAVAGTALVKNDVPTQKCHSELVYRELDDFNTKVHIMLPVLGVDPGALTGAGEVAWEDNLIGTAIADTTARCGIPEGEFCLVTTIAGPPVNKKDFCMPGYHCFTGFGEPETAAGICMADETIATESEWLLHFKIDTLAKIAENKVLLNENKVSIAANNTAIATNLTAIQHAEKATDEWFSGVHQPNDDVPDFKERGKLLLTVTVFVGLFVVPAVLFLVWKACQQPQKQTRRSVKAADDESSEDS